MYWQTYFTQYFPVIVVVVDIVCHIDNSVDSGHNKTKKAKGRHPVLGHTFCLRFLRIVTLIWDQVDVNVDENFKSISMSLSMAMEISMKFSIIMSKTMSMSKSTNLRNENHGHLTQISLPFQFWVVCCVVEQLHSWEKFAGFFAKLLNQFLLDV